MGILILPQKYMTVLTDGSRYCTVDYVVGMSKIIELQERNALKYTSRINTVVRLSYDLNDDLILVSSARQPSYRKEP